MKDATGELSMTAIAVVAIAAIGVVFTQLVWPTIKKNITRSAHCSEAYGCTAGTNGTVNCIYMTDDAGSTENIVCPSQSA
jgi:hypothetical protein